jgi:hypothetical protein
MAKKPLYATRRIEHGAVVSGKNLVSVFEAEQEVKGLSVEDIAALGDAVTETAPLKSAADADVDAKAKADADAKAKVDADAAALAAGNKT